MTEPYSQLLCPQRRLVLPCLRQFPWCTYEGGPLSLGAAASLTEFTYFGPARELPGGRWIIQRSNGEGFNKKTRLGKGNQQGIERHPGDSTLGLEGKRSIFSNPRRTVALGEGPLGSS